MKVYKKLVRDKIPEIIISKGDSAITRILSDEEFSESLKSKLCEEVNEFLSDGTVEELADIYEVLMAILEHRGISFESFEELRNKKVLEKGGFSQRIFLDSVINKSINKLGGNENDTQVSCKNY